MSNLDQHPLLAKVDAFCAAQSLSKSAFGEKAVGDPRFVFDLEAGREPRRKTIMRVEAFMASHATPTRQPRRQSGKRGVA